MTAEDYNMWLCSLDGIGVRKIQILMQNFSDAGEIFFASEDTLTGISGITSKDVHTIVESRSCFEPEQTRKELASYQMKCIPFLSEYYPEMCRQIYQPPKRLYYKGSFPKEKYRIAVVGARDCSLYGREAARYFAAGLVSAGVGIVSGMARGIDGWAHQGALESGGKTYAVLGNSAEICYPAEHQRLYRSILKQGGILSEYPPGTKARPGYFPMRNRIISALCQGILVVEARKKSGSLITAGQALEQGKDVFVIPGRIRDELSEGCNNLIKQGAFLVSEPEEILDHYGIVYEKKRQNFKNFNIFLESKEKMVYASLRLEPKNLTTIAEELDMDRTEVMKCILVLLKNKKIQEIGNHYYVKRC